MTGFRKSRILQKGILLLVGATGSIRASTTEGKPDSIYKSLRVTVYMYMYTYVRTCSAFTYTCTCSVYVYLHIHCNYDL